jgi:hypothetical protein
MSIFLSDEETIEQNELARFNKDLCQKCTRITAEAAAIHAVQFMEGECTEHTHIELAYIQDENTMRAMELNPQHRYDCPECMKQIKKELNIQ